ncbi:MAG TPA: hypothetical protein VF615_17190 [Longimicrobiaceae bacterium]|jgi:hypothetical protein
MNRISPLARCALALACGFVLSASGAAAQKALVYCPAGIDVAGCGNVAGALASAFPAGVDRGYDGSAGTVDLRTADLGGYSLVVVPSLSDNPNSRPYGLLRDAEVAGRLAGVLTGRVAVWSGTPDQGRGNRDAKNTLIRNLAAYAAEGAEAGIPGLLVLQDASADVSQRYGWLAGVSGRTLGAERTARAFGRVRGLTETGSRVAGGLAFANMAAFGLSLPEGAGWVAEVAADDSPVAFGGATRSGAYGASLVGARFAGLVRSWWDRMFAAYTVVLATSPGAGGGSARPALTLSVSPDSVVALAAGAASASLRANLATSGSCNAANLAGVKVNFSITASLNQNNTSLSSGEASWNGVNLSALTLGTSYPVTAASTASGNCAANTATGAIRVKKGTALLDLSAAGGAAGASTTLQARLVDRSPPPGNTGIQGATVSFTIGASTFTASSVGNGTATATGTLPAAPGTYKVYVRYSGSESPSFYMAALDSTTVTVSSVLATGLAVSAATGQYGGTAGLSATLVSGGSPVAGKPIAFTLNGTAVCGGSTGVVCPATNASGVASLAGVSLAGINAGTYGTGVGASFAGDGGYSASTAAGSLTIGKASQAALTLSGVPATAAYNSSFTVTPGGGSGTAPLVVTTSGVCSASGNSVTMTAGTGTCTVKVNRAGDDNYNAAAEASASATASKLAQGALTLSGVPASSAFNSTFTVAPGGGNGSASLVVSTAGVCTASGNDVTMTSGTGACTVKVNRAGDDNYDAAAEVTASANASKVAQPVLSLSGVPASAPFNSTFTVTAGGGSGSAPVVVTTAGVCSAVGKDVTMTSGTGSCTVKVNRAGDDNYGAAAEVTASASASKLSQSALSLSGVPATAPFNSTFTVTAGGGSGSGSLVLTTAGVCTATGSDVTMTSGTGSCTVKLNRAGDDNYGAAAEVTASANASKLSQAALSLSGVPASAPFNSTFTVTAGGGSGSAPLVVTTSGVCTASGNDVTMTSGTGSCTVKVNRAGDDNYGAAAEVTASANASKLSQAALSLSGVPASAPFNSTFTVVAGGGSGSAPLVLTTAGVCTASGNDVTMTSGSGSCTVRVNRAGDDNYGAASEVTASASASKLSQAALSLSGVPASAPFNSTFTVTAGGGSGSAPVVVTTSGVCSASGNAVTMTSGTGACTVKVNRAGDDNYNAASEVSASAAAAKLNQAALTLTGAPSSAPYNSTFSVTPGGGSGSASLVVTTAGVCTSSGNDVTMTSGTGTCTVKLNRAGDDNYNAAAEATVSVAASKLSQAALSLAGVPASAPYNSTFTVTPGGGSGSGSTVVTTSGVCTASGNDVTMTGGTGTCTVKVNRAGDDNYNAATEVTASAAAAKIAQSALSLAGVPATAPYNSTFTVAPGGGSGSGAAAVTTSGVCTASGNDVTMTSGTGACTVKLNRAGDANYQAAAEVTASAAAAKIAQAALAVTAPTAGTFGQKYAPAAAGGSGTGAVSFGVGASTACAIVATGPDAGKVEITRGTGTCDVTATRAADANYEQATSPALAVALSKAAQTVTFAQPATPQTFGASFAVNPVASSGLAVALAASGGCSVAPASPGYTVTMTSGTTACVLTASQAGSDDYLAAGAAAGSALERTVAAAKAPATLAFSLALPAKTYGDPEFGVATFASAGASGIAVAFSSVTPAVCTVSAAGQVQLLRSGSCTVRAAQATSADYAAGQIDQSFAVGKRALAVEYTGDSYAATGGPTIATATIRLSATVARKAGGMLGDLSLARVRFTLTKQGGGSQTVFAMADANGSAMATASVAADNDNQWLVQTSIDPDNAYWSGDFDTDPLSVVLGSTEKRTTGGGWVADAGSANGKANFGFSVAYQKNGSPRGNLTYVYRGTDGYDYVVKSNSWQGGALTFSNNDPSLAAFSGRATVQRIDRATGLADPGWPAGNYTFTVDGMDGDLKSPKVRDTFAVTIMDNEGRIWRQLGTRTAPVQLGGGNVAVQSR